MTVPDPGTNRFYDLLVNREPITMSQVLAIAASAVLTWVDANLFHFSADPIYTLAAVYVASTIIGLIYARSKAWSPASVKAARQAAYADGWKLGKNGNG